MNYSIFTAGLGVTVLMPMLSFMTTHVALPPTLNAGCRLVHVQYVDERGVTRDTEWRTVQCPGKELGRNG